MCNCLCFMELLIFRKQVQRGDSSNVRASSSVKGCYIYYENTILICFANAGCLAHPENPEMSLKFYQDPKNPGKCFSVAFTKNLKFAFP